MSDPFKLALYMAILFGAIFIIHYAVQIVPDDTKQDQNVVEVEKINEVKNIPDNAATFIYSGGCFWCTESDSEKLDGVYEAVSGFTAGSTPDPKYGYGRSGDHREASIVYYDPTKLSYRDLAIHAFNTIDYTDDGGQFCDRGREYTPAIYYKTIEERGILHSIEPPNSVVAFEKESAFYPVNDGHQDYWKKNQTRYNYYRSGCGRDRIVNALPKIEVETVETDLMVDEEKTYDLSHLTPLQYRVTQKEGTERAFTHEYHKNKAKGIYVDIVGGQALYSSKDKYSSGSGWPSFHKSIGEDGAVLIETPEFFSSAIELKSTEAKSHLGHIIFDNPHRPDRRRHCINGASLVFIPLEEMEAKGYGEYIKYV